MASKKIHEDIAQDSPSYATVKWTTDFKRGRDSIKDYPRLACPKTSTIEKKTSVIQNQTVNGNKLMCIHDMTLNARCIIVQPIAKSTGINSCSIHTVLTEILEMNKLCVWWVPRQLMPEHKMKRIDISRTLLTRFIKFTTSNLNQRFRANSGNILILQLEEVQTGRIC